MDIKSDPFEKHQKLIESLLSPDRWDTPDWRLSQILFYLDVIRKKDTDIQSDEQQYLFYLVNYHAESLEESLDIFTTTSRLLFASTPLETQPVTLLDKILQLEDEFNKEKYSELNVSKNNPKEPLMMYGDNNLLQVTFKNLGRLIKQIQPHHKGYLLFEVYREQNSAKLQITKEKFNSTNENGLSILPFEVNPEWFIVHTIADLHGGEFIVDDRNKDKCIFYLNLPLQQP